MIEPPKVEAPKIEEVKKVEPKPSKGLFDDDEENDDAPIFAKQEPPKPPVAAPVKVFDTDSEGSEPDDLEFD